MDMCEFFKYDPFSGLLTDAFSGLVLGSRNNKGYLQVTRKGRKLLVHRIAWDLSNPNDLLQDNDQIDHIDHNPLNNKIDNLRKVSASENLRNKTQYSNNKSGVTGVHFENSRGKWVAKIRINGRNKHLGYFDTVEMAAEARDKASEEFGFHKNHGDHL